MHHRKLIRLRIGLLLSIPFLILSICYHSFYALEGLKYWRYPDQHNLDLFASFRALGIIELLGAFSFAFILSVWSHKRVIDGNLSDKIWHHVQKIFGVSIGLLPFVFYVVAILAIPDANMRFWLVSILFARVAALLCIVITVPLVSFNISSIIGIGIIFVTGLILTVFTYIIPDWGLTHELNENMDYNNVSAIAQIFTPERFSTKLQVSHQVISFALFAFIELCAIFVSIIFLIKKDLLAKSADLLTEPDELLPTQE